MRWRRLTSPDASSTAWQLEEAGQWRAATAHEAATRSWLPEPMVAGSLPFQPRSFRDCSLDRARAPVHVGVHALPRVGGRTPEA